MYSRHMDIERLNEIQDVALWIRKQLLRWGRVPINDAKEKWGTVRVYCYFGWWNLHDFCYPGHHFNHFPSWLTRIDESFFSGVFNLIRFLVVPYHRWLYRHTYKRAVKKWPHLKEEILQCADWPEYLKGL